MSSSKRKLVISKADIIQAKKAREESVKGVNQVKSTLSNPKSALKKTNDSDETLNIDEQVPSSSLPAGFFDDPVKDASARSIAYVKPEEKEWSDFQRIISTESSKADELLETELIALQKERDLLEVESQIDNWAKVEALNKRLDEIKEQKRQLQQQTTPVKHGTKDTKSEDEDDDSDNENLDELFNWRSKCKLR